MIKDSVRSAVPVSSEHFVERHFTVNISEQFPVEVGNRTTLHVWSN